ncbi:hypothetical protein HMJ29_10370 [Hymenobacter taeanensis]|uniref:Uncharacterized protein n=1 Tax=Hymenobacter taeanensis TaxID=2735321 RepID=A0A6M6BH06_9BACT|nr:MULTISPECIES: hypothetical protein [Hymenobacter]QJX47320.1 hypothetical protein HMJ29_10370 [Hymenobacter taeanensis]UOQ79343.1 hypothetical protein MUN83_10760 [Hymenobacter sp. 5414T-23]
MRILYSTLLGLSTLSMLSGCKKEDAGELPVAVAHGLVLGQSCNGTLIQLLDGPAVGRPVTYNNRAYSNVFGTYSTLDNTPFQAGQTITFSLQKVIPEEAAPRMCLAIYTTYDVPQLAIAPPM